MTDDDETLAPDRSLSDPFMAMHLLLEYVLEKASSHGRISRTAPSLPPTNIKTSDEEWPGNTWTLSRSILRPSWNLG